MNKLVSLCAAIVCVAASVAFAGGGHQSVGGEVVSYDSDKDVLTFVTKEGQTLTMKSPPERLCFFQRKAAEDEFKNDMAVEVTGALNEDLTVIEATYVTIYPGTGRGGNHILPKHGRVSGKFEKKDDGWYVIAQNKPVRIEMAAKCRIMANENYKLADLKPGDRVGTWAIVTDDGELMKPSYINVVPASK